MRTPRLPYPSSPAEYLPVPAAGWSPDVPTWEMSTDQAPLLENFQIKPGKLRVRPAYRVTADVTSAAPSLAGWIPYSHGTSILTRRLFVAGQAEPQNLFRTGTSALGAAVSEDAIYEITGPTVTRHAITTSLAPSSRQIDFNGTKLAITYGGDASLGSVLGYYTITGWFTRVVTLTASSSTRAVGAPVGGLDIYGWLNRVWVLGGRAFSGSGLASSNTLFFTNPLQSLTGASDWHDPVSGLDNQIQLDGDQTDAGVAMASVPAGLVILRQNSVFILRGTDPSSYVVRPVSKQAGCIDARSVVEMDSKVYFMSEQGLMVTDGTRVQNISGALQDELYRQIAWFNLNVFNGASAWCTCDAMSDGKILMSMGACATGNVSINYPMVGSISAVFDVATGAWVKVSTAIAPVSNGSGNLSLGPAIQGYGQLQTLGNTKVVSIEDNVVGYGTSFSSSLHDVATVSPSYVPITATWAAKSPGMALSSRLKNHMKLAYLDYAVSTGLATGTVSLQLTDRISNVALLNTSVPASTNSSDPRQYLERDVYGEATDVGITVTVQGTGTGSPVVNKAEVHGVGVEFNPSSSMRPIV